jgi:hypothetical protein
MSSITVMPGLLIASILFASGAILSLLRFRKKVRLIRSLSSDRELDVYVPYNMLFYGATKLNGYGRQWGMAFPYDKTTDVILVELKNSWVSSLTLLVSTFFAIGTALLYLMSTFHK